VGKHLGSEPGIKPNKEKKAMISSSFPNFSQKSLPFEAFRKFKNKYTRATNNFLIICKLTENQAFSRVRKNPKAWIRFKIFVKLHDIQLKSPKKHPEFGYNLVEWVKSTKLLQLYYTPDYHSLKKIYDFEWK
jgi:hypothetical protein